MALRVEAPVSERYACRPSARHGAREERARVSPERFAFREPRAGERRAEPEELRRALDPRLACGSSGARHKRLLRVDEVEDDANHEEHVGPVLEPSSDAALDGPALRPVSADIVERGAPRVENVDDVGSGEAIDDGAGP